MWRNVEGRAREAIHKQQAGQDETYRKAVNAVKRRKQTRNSTQTFWIDYSDLVTTECVTSCLVLFALLPRRHVTAVRPHVLFL